MGRGGCRVGGLVDVEWAGAASVCGAQAHPSLYASRHNPLLTGSSTPAHQQCKQAVDRFNNLTVTAFVTPGNARFLLLHDGRGDDSIKAFFTEVYELFLKVGVWEGGRPGAGAASTSCEQVIAV